jgi:hypothetical protein
LDKKEKELTSKQESLDQREADMKIKEKAIRELYEQKLQKMYQLKMANQSQNFQPKNSNFLLKKQHHDVTITSS